MKFLKTQNTSRFGLKDNAFKANPYGRYTMDGTGGLRLPKGTTAQQPNLSGVEMPNGANGMLRYNTTTDELECYIAGFWETVKGSATNSIIQQSTLGPGNFIETNRKLIRELLESHGYVYHRENNVDDDYIHSSILKKIPFSLISQFNCFMTP